MPKKGFTLIELLIAISIIAIISATGFTTYSIVLKQGRDSKRQSDLRVIQSALEQYYSDQGFYPAVNLPYGNPLTNQTGNPIIPPPPLKTYLNAIPTDSGGTPYLYSPFLNSGGGECSNASATTRCSTYSLSAKLDVSVGIGATAPGGRNFILTPP